MKKKRTTKITKAQRAAAKSEKLAKKLSLRRPPPMRAPSWRLLTSDTLEDARKRRGMSKAAWSRLLGVGVSTYWNWLRGYAVPPLSRQRRLLQQCDAETGLQNASAMRAMIEESGGAATPATLRSLRPSGDALVQAVQAIMTSLAAQGKLDPERAPEIARDLRRSLAGE